MATRATAEGSRAARARAASGSALERWASPKRPERSSTAANAARPKATAATARSCRGQPQGSSAGAAA
eukprot:2220140-Alexandrium_andersonii.AAC.1